MPSYQQRGERSWYLYVEAGTKPDGSRDRKTRTIKIDDAAILKSEKKTIEHLDSEWYKFKAEIESGLYIKPGKMTFSSFMDIWETKFVLKHLEETTIFNYLYHANKRIRPHFGEKTINKIKTMHLVDFLDKLADEGVGSATRVYVFRVLRSIFTKAKEWKILTENPMDGVTKPKDTPKEMEVYSEEEVYTLLAALEKEDIRFRVIVSLALTTGMRRAEILGLEWKHIDLDKGIIDIKQTIPKTKKEGAVIKGPKRQSSVRKIVVPSSVVVELKVYQAHMMRVRSNSEIPWEGGDYHFVFARKNGLPLHTNSIGDRWRSFHRLRCPGIKYIRFHDLRHTSATLLINQGVHAKIISSRLGHAKISTTMNVYGHVIESADRAAADTFDNLFNPPNTAKQKTR